MKTKRNVTGGRHGAAEPELHRDGEREGGQERQRGHLRREGRGSRRRRRAGEQEPHAVRPSEAAARAAVAAQHLLREQGTLFNGMQKSLRAVFWVILSGRVFEAGNKAFESFYADNQK